MTQTITDLTKKIKQTILEYLNSKYTENCVDELLSLASTLDNPFNNDDKVKAIKTAVTADPMAIVTVTDSPTPGPGPSTASAQAMTAEPDAGYDDTSESHFN